MTTKEHKGLNPGRRIQFRNENYETASNLWQSDIEFKSPRIFVRDVSINYGTETLVYSLQGVSYQFQQIENANMAAGRFINYQDEVNTQKVAVIGNKIAHDVFTDIETPVGEFIDVSGIPFKIIGVFGETEDREEERIYIPITTAQRVFNGGDRINNMAYTLPPVENFDEAVVQAVNFKNDLRSYLQQVHMVAPDDTSGVEVWSAMEEAKRYYGNHWEHEKILLVRRNMHYCCRCSRGKQYYVDRGQGTNQGNRDSQGFGRKTLVNCWYDFA